jgi:hypothetical protein
MKGEESIASLDILWALPAPVTADFTYFRFCCTILFALALLSGYFNLQSVHKNHVIVELIIVLDAST